MVVDEQMELESIEPAHAVLAPLCIVSKYPMRADAPGMTDGYRGRVNKGDARRLSSILNDSGGRKTRAATRMASTPQSTYS